MSSSGAETMRRKERGATWRAARIVSLLALLAVGCGARSSGADGGALVEPGESDFDSAVEDSGGDADADTEQETEPDSAVDTSPDTAIELPCDDTRLPLVVVHGMFDAGGTFEPNAMRFVSNGYCARRIFLFDWNTVVRNDAVSAKKLTAFIDDVLASTGAAQIDLLGHSAGGGLSSTYLAQDGAAAKVAHYAHVASFSLKAPPGGVPTLTLSSPADTVAKVCNIPGATKVVLEGLDHLQVLTSEASFVELYRFFTGEEPVTTEITPQTTLELGGRVVTLGENVPGAGWKVRVFELDPASGGRRSETPNAEVETDATGHFGKVIGKAGTYYELEAAPEKNGRKLHYFREPFVRSSSWIYLRVFPTNPLSPTNLLLSQLPNDDKQSVVLAFTASQTVVNGRDTLSADGYDLAGAEMAAAGNATIAVFLFDSNKNGKTDATRAAGLFKSMPFFEGFDLFIPTSEARSIPVVFNGRTLNVPNLKSKSDGVVVASFN